MYTPKTREELSRRVLGALTSRSRLSDTREGSVIHTLAQSVGALAAGTEQRLAAIRSAYDFRNAAGAELDERLLDYPESTLQRKAAQRARGSIGLIIQEGLTAPLTIPEGSTFSRSDNGAIYATLEAVTVAVGAPRVIAVEVEAAQSGLSGNAPSSTINQIEEAPSEIISVNNGQALTNGADQESDEALKRRALLYLQSLARCQPAALEFAALSADLDNRLVIADLVEDPHAAGLSRLYIDDGSGALGAQVAQGRINTFTAPAGGVTRLYHDHPAVNEVTPAKLVNNVFTPLAPQDFVSIPERGEIYIVEGRIQAGDQVTLEPYQIYTGAIAEIQSLIEGDPSSPQASGYRAAGTRVIVLSPSIAHIDLTIEIMISGGDRDLITTSITQELTALTSSLRVGEPLFAARVIDSVMNITHVINVHLYTSNGDSFTDFYPPLNAVVRFNSLVINPVEA